MYLTVSLDFYWTHQYQLVRKYTRAREVCQRVKPIPLSRAALQPLPTPGRTMAVRFNGLRLHDP